MAIDGDVLVWLADGNAVGDSVLADFVGWLSAGEAQRYYAFVRPLRRRQFLIGRVLLRQALGALLERSPHTLRLLERPGAAPLLDLPQAASIGLSISHSGPWVACAVSASTLVGLDIEVIDDTRDLAALAEQAFDAQQLACWRNRPKATRTRDFYDAWCAGEARIKLNAAAGSCIHLPHAALAIALCSAQPLALAPRLELRAL